MAIKRIVMNRDSANGDISRCHSGHGNRVNVGDGSGVNAAMAKVNGSDGDGVNGGDGDSQWRQWQ